jgi:nicotinate-nucleotide adenylyltransferase
VIKIPPHPLSSSTYRRLRIGLLGGSFNPAHEGHVHISLLAIKRMRLHQVWWLISPQNPLKPAQGMADFAERKAEAEKLTRHHPRIIVSDLERQLGSRYTADTLSILRLKFSQTRFFWMMGADNLLQIPHWECWQSIFKLADVAVFRRPPYAVGVLRGIAAQRFSNQRRDDRKAALLGQTQERNWVLFGNRLNAESATHIRATRERTK